MNLIFSYILLSFCSPLPAFFINSVSSLPSQVFLASSFFSACVFHFNKRLNALIKLTQFTNYKISIIKIKKELFKCCLAQSRAVCETHVFVKIFSYKSTATSFYFSSLTIFISLYLCYEWRIYL